MRPTCRTRCTQNGELCDFIPCARTWRTNDLDSRQAPQLFSTRTRRYMVCQILYSTELMWMAPGYCSKHLARIFGRFREEGHIYIFHRSCVESTRLERRRGRPSIYSRRRLRLLSPYQGYRRKACLRRQRQRNLHYSYQTLWNDRVRCSMPLRRPFYLTSV